MKYKHRNEFDRSRATEGWNDGSTTVACPACSNGEVLTPDGTGHHNGHLVGAWFDDMGVRFDLSEDGPAFGGSLNDGRGSEVGFSCSFEQCPHVVEYRFRFHKGDVYLSWRVVKVQTEGDMLRAPELART